MEDWRKRMGIEPAGDHGTVTAQTALKAEGILVAKGGRRPYWFGIASILALTLNAGYLSSESPIRGACSVVAGQYASGDGFVARALELHANCSLRITCRSDGGESWQWSGQATFSNSILQVGANERQIPRQFTLVRWGTRSYLVSSSALLEFCNAFNAETEPSMLDWVMSKGQTSERPEGIPQVPAPLRRFLLDRPLIGKVLHIVREERDEVRAEGSCTRKVKVQNALVAVNLGADQGLLPGMRLHASNPRRPNVSGDLRVTRVDSTSAQAEVEFQVGRVRAGDSVSTTFQRR